MPNLEKIKIHKFWSPRELKREDMLVFPEKSVAPLAVGVARWQRQSAAVGGGAVPRSSR